MDFLLDLKFTEVLFLLAGVSLIVTFAWGVLRQWHRRRLDVKAPRHLLDWGTFPFLVVTTSLLLAFFLLAFVQESHVQEKMLSRAGSLDNKLGNLVDAVAKIRPSEPVAIPGEFRLETAGLETALRELAGTIKDRTAPDPSRRESWVFALSFIVFCLGILLIFTGLYLIFKPAGLSEITRSSPPSGDVQKTSQRPQDDPVKTSKAGILATMSVGALLSLGGITLVKDFNLNIGCCKGTGVAGTAQLGANVQFEDLGQIGPFDDGSELIYTDRGKHREPRSAENEEKRTKSVSDAAQRLCGKESPRILRSLILVGSADKRALHGQLASHYESNAALARARALNARGALIANRACASRFPADTRDRKGPTVIILESAPSILEARSSGKNQLSKELEGDRHVKVFAVWSVLDPKP